MNKLDFYYNDDPREKPLRDAVYRAIRRVEPSSMRGGISVFGREGVR